MRRPPEHERDGDRPLTKARTVVVGAVVLVLAGVLAAILLIPGSGGRGTPAGTGGLAPTFSLDNLQVGQPEVSLAALRGRPVVLNFWAAWCVPCKEELPAFQAAHRRLGVRVAFVGIDRQDNRDDALQFAARAELTYPSAYDPNGSLDGPYRLLGTPTTVFVSPTGRIVDHVTGQLSQARLDGALQRLFGV